MAVATAAKAKKGRGVSTPEMQEAYERGRNATNGNGHKGGVNGSWNGEPPTPLNQLELTPGSSKRLENLLDKNAISSIERMSEVIDVHPEGRYKALQELGLEPGLAQDTLDALESYHAHVTPPKSGAAAAVEAELGPEEVRQVPVKNITVSPTNPRKHFDETKLAELAESIKEKGVVQPILVRPKKTKTTLAGHQVATVDGFEIVAGERRWRASVLAGRIVIPAIVREYTDKQVAEIQIIENLQRDDLDPLEEAQGYEVLMRAHGYTAETLAAKIGKHKGYVYGCLKLAALPPKAAAALRDGAISKSHAQLIARVPSPKLRDKATKEILQGDLYQRGRVTSQPMSLRAAQEHVHRHFMIELKQAPFGLRDTTLSPSAGACTACPKMTANNRDEFPDARGDVCTDPECFEHKVAIHRERLVAEHKAAGRQILSKKEAEKALQTWQSGYVDLADNCYEDGKNRSYKKLVGEELAAEIVIAQDREGALHQLVKKNRAAEILKQKKIGQKSSSGNDRWRRQQAAQLAEHKLRAKLDQRLMGLVAAEAEAKAGGFLRVDVALLRTIAGPLIHHTWNDICRHVVRRRGLEVQKKKEHWGIRPESFAETLERALASMDVAALIGLLAEVAAGRKLLDREEGSRLKPFFATFGVDNAKVEKEVKAELAKKKKGKKPAGDRRGEE